MAASAPPSAPQVQQEKVGDSPAQRQAPLKCRWSLRCKSDARRASGELTWEQNESSRGWQTSPPSWPPRGACYTRYGFLLADSACLLLGSILGVLRVCFCAPDVPGAVGSCAVHFVSRRPQALCSLETKLWPPCVKQADGAIPQQHLLTLGLCVTF